MFVRMQRLRMMKLEEEMQASNKKVDDLQASNKKPKVSNNNKKVEELQASNELVKNQKQVLVFARV